MKADQVRGQWQPGATSEDYAACLRAHVEELPPLQEQTLRLVAEHYLKIPPERIPAALQTLGSDHIVETGEALHP